MSNKKKPRKQHNPDKRAQRFFNNVRLWSWESMRDDKESVRIAHGEAKVGMVWRQLTQKQVIDLAAKTNHWVICCRALCKAGDKEWVETSIRSGKNLKVNDFAEVYDDMRAEVMASVQGRHVYDCGWIVQSFNKIDRTDSNFELKYLGEATYERRMQWLDAVEKEMIEELKEVA